MPRPKFPIRLLTAVPLCDGHDSAISTINLEFIKNGIEVIYLGYHRSVRDIVRAAIQEDVRGIGLSSYNGGHVEFFSQVVAELRRNQAQHIGVFGGGGGTITHHDARVMQRRGVKRIFFPGEPLAEMVAYVKTTFARPTTSQQSDSDHRTPEGCFASLLTAAEQGRRQFREQKSSAATPVIGITGPGGAGKTTLIDELVLRFLRRYPKGHIAILSHDPSIVGDGALLGDRATMIYSQDDRVFMRSIASRGHAGGLAATSRSLVHLLRHTADFSPLKPFDLIIVETVGIGQEAVPFSNGLADVNVLVMSPDYGARLQLQKIVMLDVADVVVINKSDLSQAKTASSEVQRRLDLNHRGQRIISTIATQHNNPGVDELFKLIAEKATGSSGNARLQPSQPTRKRPLSRTPRSER